MLKVVQLRIRDRIPPGVEGRVRRKQLYQQHLVLTALNYRTFNNGSVVVFCPYKNWLFLRCFGQQITRGLAITVRSS
jgi:hypothetical protein